MDEIYLTKYGAPTIKVPIRIPAGRGPDSLVPTCFEMHSGASNWGRGRFLCNRKAFTDVFTTNGGPGTLTMTDTDVGRATTRTLAIPVMVAGTRFLAGASSAGAANTDLDMIEIVCYDYRCNGLVIKPPFDGYNVQNPTSPNLFTSTKKSASTEWTWTEFAATGLTTAFSFYDPPDEFLRNIVLDGVPWCRAVDAVAQTLGMVVGYDPMSATGATPGVGTVTLYDPDNTSNGNITMLTDAEPYRIGGGKTAKYGGRVPATIEFRFKRNDIFKTTSLSDPYTDRWYKKDYTVTIEGATPVGTLVILMPHMAIRNGASWVEQAKLDIVANAVGVRIEKDYASVIEEITYAGLWDFKLDGNIRGVLWISDKDGPRTTIRRNDERDFYPWMDDKLAYEYQQFGRVIAIDAPTMSTIGVTGGMIWQSELGENSCD